MYTAKNAEYISKFIWKKMHFGKSNAAEIIAIIIILFIYNNN
jgi:hypothetical protein